MTASEAALSSGREADGALASCRGRLLVDSSWNLKHRLWKMLYMTAWTLLWLVRLGMDPCYRPYENGRAWWPVLCP